MAIPVPSRARDSHFYKYSTSEHLDWLKVIILENKLYLPSLTQLNDPADGRPTVAPLSTEGMYSFIYGEFINRNPHLTSAALKAEQATIRLNIEHHGTETLRRTMTEVFHSYLEGARIYSMSRRYDNLSLWAKYAADHTGYCLEFVNMGPMFEHAKEVIYGDSVPMDVNNPQDRNGYWFFCKRREWSNEEEIRLVLPAGKGCIAIIEPAWLSRIILGKNMTEANREQVRAWAKQRRPELAVANAGYDDFRQVLTLTET